MKDEDEKKWILLSKNKVKGGYVQTGPFSETEVKERIQSGRISYVDLLWTEGFPEWTEISKIEKFAYKSDVKTNEIKKQEPPKPDDSDKVKRKEKEDSQNDGESSNVVELKTLKQVEQVIEERPPGAEGDDLVQNDRNKGFQSLMKAQEKELKEKRKKILRGEGRGAVRPMGAPLKNDEMSSSENKKQSRPKKQKTPIAPEPDMIDDLTVHTSVSSVPVPESLEDFYEYRKRRLGDKRSVKNNLLNYSIVSMVLFVISLIGFYMFNEVQKRAGQKERLESDYVATMTSPQNEKPMVVENPQIKKVTPTYLEYRIRKQSLRSIIIDTRTDASEHYPVFIEIEAGPGQVIGRPRFYLSQQVNGLSNEWERTRLTLARGFFNVKLSVGVVEKRDKISIGDAGQLRNQLNSFKKQLVYSHIKEKQKLYWALDQWSLALEEYSRGRNQKAEALIQSTKTSSLNSLLAAGKAATDVFYPDLAQEVAVSGQLVEQAITKNQPVSGLRYRLRELNHKVLSKNLW